MLKFRLNSSAFLHFNVVTFQNFIIHCFNIDFYVNIGVIYKRQFEKG